MSARCIAAWLLFIGFAAASLGQEAPGDKEPLLLLEAGGPTSFVTSPVFSSDGKTLYAAGWTKALFTFSTRETAKSICCAGIGDQSCHWRSRPCQRGKFRSSFPPVKKRTPPAASAAALFAFGTWPRARCWRRGKIFPIRAIG